MNDSNDPNQPPSKDWRSFAQRKLGGAKKELTQWTSRTQTRLQKLRSLKREDVVRSIQNFDAGAAIEWFQRSVRAERAAFYGTAATIALSSFFAADLIALFAGRFIPEPPPARTARLSSGNSGRLGSVDDFANVWTRNLFNSKGLLPGEATGPQDSGGAPVKTGLPLTLVGTVILENELKSIATIEDKSDSLVYPVRMNDEIPSKVRIIKVEPKRVTFLNIASGRREYVELPEDTNEVNPRINLGVGSPKTTGAIEKVSPTQWSVPRSEVDKAFGDLNGILTQARAVPNFKNGVPYGYKLFQVVPNSLYTKLGLQDADTILGVDGEPINDPAQALSKLSNLRTANKLELQVERNGKTQTFTYDIN